MKKNNKALLFAAALLFFTCGCITKGAKTVNYENGLRSILINDKNSLVSSVYVFVRAGAIDEKPSQAGLSHFLEHLMFKGSKNYPGDELSRKVENMGGYINAMTSNEYTAYYINVQKDGAGQAVKMLADTMQNPLFPKDDIDRERKVVIEEIQRHFDNPMSVLDEKFMENIYPTSALKNSVIGTSDIIANVSRDEIYAYYSAHYVPEKMVVVVAGNFDEGEVSSLISETFGKFEKKAPPADPKVREDLSGAKDITDKGNVEIGYLFSGFLGPVIESDDIFTADLAACILGGGKSSRLYRILKEEKQLVVSIGSSFMTCTGNGILYISSAFDPKNLDAIKEEIIKQIDDIVQNGVNPDELARAKLSMKTNWSFAFEKPSDIGYFYGYWNLMKRPEAVEEYMKKIQSLTTQDVRDFFVKYYSRGKIVNAALLPKDANK
ncbi:MAG: insulinase family protein [Endomicrobium sp.]|jgi:zinc protease|nr:insulinase family protein [Endomicrobium sp.]